MRMFKNVSLSKADWPIIETLEDPKKQLQADIRNYLEEQVKMGIESAQLQEGQAEITVDWDRVLTDAVEYLDNYSLLISDYMSSQAVWELTKVIQDELIAGHGAMEIAKSIDELDSSYEGRSEMIARTEGMRALNQSRIQSYREMGFTEYVWIASDLACDECAPMDGNIYQEDELPNIPLHPNCYAPDTKINFLDGQPLAILRGLYSGPIIEIITGTGKNLKVTPNHPILTPGGFVPAKLLNKGMDVICYRGIMDIGARHNHDKNNELSIEQIFNLVSGLGHLKVMPLTSPDLHGDGSFIKGEIHIADINGSLLGKLDAPVSHGPGKFPLMFADIGKGSLNSKGSINEIGMSSPHASNSIMGSLDLSDPLSLGHPGPFDNFLEAPGSDGDLIAPQEPFNDSPGNLIFLGELIDRYSRFIFFDEVVEIRAYPFSGHVYDLQTTNHISIGNNILCHNCRCTVAVKTKFTEVGPDGKVVWGD